MSIKTTSIQLSPLRGIDQRWDTDPRMALNITNMVWSDRDSWVTARGYNRLVQDAVTTTKVTLIEKDTSIPKQSLDSEGSAQQYVNLSPSAYTYGSSYKVRGTKTNTYAEQSPPNSIGILTRHADHHQYLTYETRDGKLRFFNGSKAPEEPYSNVRFYTGATVTRNSSGLDVAHTIYGTFGSGQYLINPSDQPLVFDGRKAMQMGYTSSPHPLEAESRSAKSDIKSGSYGLGYKDSSIASTIIRVNYKVTFVNERGQESPASISTSLEVDLSTPTYFANGKTVGRLITLTLPKGPPSTVARRIYRTQNHVNADGTVFAAELANRFYFLDEVQDNVTQLYVDARDDLQLGSALDEDSLGAVPFSMSNFAVFKNTVFVSSEDSPVLRYSRPLHPEVFPSGNVFDLSDSLSSKITAFHVTKNSLIVFKSRGIYLIKGDPANGFFGFTLSTDVGCIAAQSVREVPGVGVFFLSSDGIYCLEGALENTGTQTKVLKVSQVIRDLMNRVNFEYSEKFRSVIYHNDREYWLSVCLDNETTPGHILKFSYEIGAWSLYDNFLTAGIVETPDHRGYLVSAAPSTLTSGAARGLYVYGSGNLKYGVDEYSSTYESVNIPFNSVYQNFSPARIQARVVGRGNKIKCEVITNREVNVVATSADATQQRPLEDFGFPIYGTAIFDSGAQYKEHRPIIARFDISTMHKGPVNELRVKFSTDDEMELINYIVEARVGGSRDILNLSEKFGGALTR